MTVACKYGLDVGAPAYCETHACGMKASGALVMCGKQGCPHCGPGRRKSTPNVALLTRRLDDAVRRRDRWLPKMTRAASEVSNAVAEIRRLRGKLEAAGVFTDEDTGETTVAPGGEP